MKKLISIVLILALVLSLGVSAFAEISINGESFSAQGVLTDQAQYVSANENGDELIVLYSVNNTDYPPEKAIALVDASNGAQIEIGDSVLGAGSGINARYAGTTVTVGGEVNNTDGQYAIKAADGATVTVEDSVTGDYKESTIIADGATVTVGGSVTDSGKGNAITAYGGTVTVTGDVTESGAGDAINASEGATVLVAGNVSQSDEGVAISVSDGATIIVEGSVTGWVDAQTSADDCVYIGQLQSGTISTYDGNNVHYLIGLAADSELTFEDVSMSGDDIIDPSKTIQGLEKSYLYTKAVDGNVLVGKSVTLKPTEDPAEGKVLSVSGLGDAKVECVTNADGTVTCKILSDFTGGLQNLMLALKNIAHGNEEIYVVYVPDYLVSAADVTLPEGLTEADVSLYNRDSHAGITLSASLLSGNARDSVKVFRGSEELPSGNYSFLPHKDGSVSVILSNTYLLSLGSGSYDFTVAAGGLEIPFTVTVAK